MQFDYSWPLRLGGDYLELVSQRMCGQRLFWSSLKGFLLQVGNRLLRDGLLLLALQRRRSDGSVPGQLDQDARQWPRRPVHRARRRPLKDRLHPAVHVLQRGAGTAAPAHNLPQRRGLHHVHGSLLGEQRLPRQPLHDPRPQDFGVQRAPRDDGHGDGSLPCSWHWQWVILELPHHEGRLIAKDPLDPGYVKPNSRAKPENRVSRCRFSAENNPVSEQNTLP